MKIPAAWVVAIGLAAVAFGQPAPSTKTTSKSPAPPAAKKADAKQKKEDEKPGKIEGMEIARGENGFLGVQIVNGNFKINFYDPKKKPKAPDVGRAALRWDPKYKLGMERGVLTPAGPHALGSTRFVRPPYNFKLTIVLLGEGAEGDEPAGETHVIDFRQ